MRAVDFGGGENDRVTDAREPLRLIVDSEVFEIVETPDQPGQCHYIWLSGPNPGYGFTSAWSPLVCGGAGVRNP